MSPTTKHPHNRKKKKKGCRWLKMSYQLRSRKSKRGFRKEIVFGMTMKEEKADARNSQLQLDVTVTRTGKETP